MAVRARLRSAAASDTGRRRTNNEDRQYVDAERGIFAVIDGVGGHAAGEQAADTAVQVIRERLERQTGTPEERLREAIALANNEIYRQARTRVEWNGMACVLTIALIEDDIVTVGHVGDSRLYLLRPGEIHKITHDHSPVGEREDRGELSEADAMRHPRRNEIYRDVGTSDREPDDPTFIEILSFPMPPDGALLLCSDGLTDLITSGEVRAAFERYAPDYETVIAALVDAANHAGGKDNITAVAVASPGYKPRPVEAPIEIVARPAAPPARRWPAVFYGGLAGLVAGIAIGFAVPYVRSQFASAEGPRTLIVGSAGINATLSQAHSGDTVIIPQGKYRERVFLREGVAVRAQPAASVTILSPDGGAVVVAQRIETGSIEGVWIQGDLQSPTRAGIEVADSSPLISNVRITGALTGIIVRGASAPTITSSQIASNLGPGIRIEGGAKPRIDNNLIAANGNGQPGDPRPGVEVFDPVRPVLKDNGIVDNAAEAIRIHGHEYARADYEENFFGGTPPAKAIHVIDILKPEPVATVKRAKR